MNKKAVFSFLVIALIIFSAVPTFAQETLVRESLSSDSNRASFFYQAEDSEKAGELAEAFINSSHLVVGEEKVLSVDGDRVLSMELTSIEEAANTDAITPFSAVSLENTPTYIFTVNESILGIKYTVCVVKLYATYIADGWNGFIINLHGELSDIHFMWNVRWEDAYRSAADFSHSLGITAKSGSTSAYAIWFASYNPLSSICTISN